MSKTLTINRPRSELSSYPIEVDKKLKEDFSTTHMAFLAQKHSLTQSLKDEQLQQKRLKKLQLQHKLAMQQQERLQEQQKNQNKLELEKKHAQLIQRRSNLQQIRDLKQRQLTVKSVNREKELVYLSQKETLIKKKTINYIQKEKSQQNQSIIVRNKIKDYQQRVNSHDDVVMQQQQISLSILSQTENKFKQIKKERENEVFQMNQLQRSKQRQIQMEIMDQDDYKEEIQNIQQNIRSSGLQSSKFNNKTKPLRASLVLSDQQSTKMSVKSQKSADNSIQRESVCDSENFLEVEMDLPEIFDYEIQDEIVY